MPVAGDAGGIGVFPAAAGIARVGGQLSPGMSLTDRGRILNFLGMGIPELAVIFLGAFLALGLAKLAGRKKSRSSHAIEPISGAE